MNFVVCLIFIINSHYYCSNTFTLWETVQAKARPAQITRACCRFSTKINKITTTNILPEWIPKYTRKVKENKQTN